MKSWLEKFSTAPQFLSGPRTSRNDPWDRIPPASLLYLFEYDVVVKYLHKCAVVVIETFSRVILMFQTFIRFPDGHFKKVIDKVVDCDFVLVKSPQTGEQLHTSILLFCRSFHSYHTRKQ